MVSLSTFHCVDIYGTWYKSSDLSKTCYDSEWTLDASISMFGIVRVSVCYCTGNDLFAAPDILCDWNSPPERAHSLTVFGLA